MKKSDFQNVPTRTRYDEDIGEFDSLVLIPTRKKHDSGLMCMDFVACIKGKPICRLSGHSDVLNIDGIGGYGKWHGSVPETIRPKGWSIECLPCGYLHMWCKECLEAGDTLSSFEIYTNGKDRRDCKNKRVDK